MYIPCKYKFLDKEKFDGKPYCTLFGELCEDVFAELGYTNCVENCQVYEDYKELEKLKKHLAEPPYIRKTKFLRELLAKMTKLKTALKEIKKIIDQSCKNCMNDFLNEDYCSEGDCKKILDILDEVLE